MGKDQKGAGVDGKPGVENGGRVGGGFGSGMVEEVERHRDARVVITSQLYLSTRIARHPGVGTDGGRRACRIR